MKEVNKSSLFYIFTLTTLIILAISIFIPVNLWAADIEIEKIDGDIVSNGDGTFTLSNIVIWITNRTNNDRPINEIRLRCFINNTPITGTETYFTNVNPNILLKKSVEAGMQAFDLGNTTWVFGSDCTGVGIQVSDTQANAVGEQILMIDFTDFRSINTLKSLDFGSFSAADGSITVTPYSGYSLSNIIYHDGEVQAAEFEVGGLENTSFMITLPTSITISYNNTNEMIVNNFTSSLTNNTGVIETGGSTKNFFVGADLIVNSGQVPGEYTGYFVVTADFY